MGSSFVSKRVSRTSTITLNGSLKEVFPLFGPIREQEWADGWAPRILFPAGGGVEEHMVFRTSSHGHGEPDFTWLVSKYLPEQAVIEYTVFTPERVWWITIRCREAASERTTKAEISYAFLGLTDMGNAINENAARLMYAHDLKDWEAAINHYLETGKRLSHQSG